MGELKNTGTRILNWLGPLGNWLRAISDAMTVVVKWIFKRVFAAVILLIVLIKGVYDSCVGLIQDVVDSANNLKTTINDNQTGEYESLWMYIIDIMEQVNYIFPIEEMLSIMVFMAVLWSTCNIYRLAKSWVPTLS